jgi:uncharacterized protein YjbI with pentapeptide repeats
MMLANPKSPRPRAVGVVSFVQGFGTGRGEWAMMADDKENPESRAGEAKPPKIKAEDNPWYLLATLNGVPDLDDRERRAKNRAAWNQYFAASLDEETRTKLIDEKRYPAEELRPLSLDELQVIATAFAERGKASAKELTLPASGARINFSNVEFEQDILFGGYIFRDSCFLSATFSGAANFNRATFLGGGSSGSAGANYNGVTFSGPANFSRATFSDGAYFADATFSGFVEFDGAIISGAVYFKSARFNSVAYFNDANFTGTDNRSGMTFCDTANGPIGVSSLVTDFDDAVFSGGVYFEGVSFPSSTHFSGTVFSDVAIFSGATFSGRVNFGGATFSGITTFDRSIFSSY